MGGRESGVAPLPWVVPFVASAGAFMAFVDSTIVNIAFPDLRRTFPSSSLSSLAWVFNAYNVVVAACLIPAGRLADRYGRRRAFELGIAVFTGASLVCALSQSVEMLVLGRVLQAVGAAVLIPASLSLVVAFAAPERRATAVGAWGAIAALGAAAGMPLGGLLVDLGDWRLIFLVNLPIGALSLLAAHRLLDESRDATADRTPDLAGMAVAALGMGLLALGIVKSADWGWGDGRVVLSLVAAVALAVVLAQRSARHHTPVLELSLFRVRGVALADGLSLVAGAGYFAYILTNVLYLTSIWGYSILDAGLAVLPSAGMGAIAAGPAGRAADRYGFRRVIAIGAVLWCAGVLWWTASMGASPAYVADFLPGQILTGAGAGIVMAMAAAWSLAVVPANWLGIAAATNIASRQIGAVLGISLAVAIIGSALVASDSTALKHAWLFSAACFALVAAGCALPARRASAMPAPGAGAVAE